MATEELEKSYESESFLYENLNEKMKNCALERASKINHFATSVTIGPNSIIETTFPMAKDSKKVSFKINSKDQNDRKQNLNKSSMTSEDYKALQQRIQQKISDKQLHEKVQEQLQIRAHKEFEFYQKLNNARKNKEVEALHKIRARKEMLDRQIEAELKILEQQELAYKKQRDDLMMNNRKNLEQQEKELKESLKKLQDHFGKLENAFNKIVQSCNPEMSQILEVYKRQFEEVKLQKNTVSASLDGLKKACINVEELCHLLIAANDEYNKQQLARKAQKEADEKKAQKEAEKIEVLTKAEAARAAAAQVPQEQPLIEERATKFFSQNGTGNYFNQLIDFLDQKYKGTKQLSEAKELESLRFALKIAVNSPINYLNETKRSSLIEGFQKLQLLLSGERVETSKGIISVNDHQQANDWTKLRLAEKLIDVCDKKPETIFYVAAVTVALCQKFPEFAQIFIAKLYKECPFLMPYKPPQQNGQSDEDFLKTWGYRMRSDQPEMYVVYQERTSKFATFFSAIWITHSRREEKAANPFGIDYGWKYLVNTFNSRPDPMYLHLLDKILETSGSTLHQTFGKQFVKLMIMLRDCYLPAVEQSIDSTMRAALDRLRVTISTFFRDNRFEQPKGKINPNFW